MPTPDTQPTQRATGASVQRPPTPRKRVKRYRLGIERIRPLIRIAHHLTAPLRIASRVIVDHEIVLITRGESVFVTNGVPIPLRAGMLVIIPPFVEHRFETRPGAISEHAAIHFDLSPDIPGTSPASRSGAYRVELSHGQSIPTCHPITPGAAVRAALSRIVHAFADPTPIAELECSGLLTSVLARLIGDHAAASTSRADDPHRTRIETSIAFIDAHLHEPLEVERIAEYAGLSPSRFRAVFGRWMGIAPHQYITQRRIDQARQLLSGDERSIKQIARQCGFADEFHFSKAFRRIDGLPPSLYRLQARASR
jgi:AraC-like DNA-binding protein